jgi:hypothetical protein
LRRVELPHRTGLLGASLPGTVTVEAHTKGVAAMCTRDGYRVEPVITPGGGTDGFYRVTRRDRLVAECCSIEEVARYVDLAELDEESENESLAVVLQLIPRRGAS